MNPSFFVTQLDYLYFLYGLLLMVLAVFCFVFGKKPLPWLYLALYGLLRGLSQWTALQAVSWSGAVFPVLHLILTASAYFFLFEFGRAGLRVVSGRTIGRWIYCAIFILILPGFFGGLNSAEVFCRFFLGFTGCLLVARVFYLAGKSDEKKGHLLRIAGICLMFYSILLPLGGPRVDFFPASFVNRETFQETFGFPNQILSILLIFSVLLALLGSFSGSPEAGVSASGAWRRKTGSWAFGLLFLAIVFLGWLITEKVGRSADRELRKSLLFQTEMAASTLDGGLAGKLTGTAADIGKIPYETLKRRLIAVRAMSPDFFFAVLSGSRGGRMRLLADSEPPSSRDYSPPDEPRYRHSPEMESAKKVEADGSPVVMGPYSDFWGEWVSALSPVRDRRSRKVTAVISLSLSAGDWRREIATLRLSPILITMVICLFMLGFYVIYRRSLDAARMIAAVEKEKIDRELSIAREIQMGMIPVDFPSEDSGFSIRGLLEPARTVSGDFYDFFMADGRTLWFCLGDVSGKGIPAALFMVVTRTLFRSLVSEGGSLSRVFSRLNRELLANNSSFMFVTAVAGILDLSSGMLTYVNAGHDAPCLIRRDGRKVKLEECLNSALGIEKPEEFIERQVLLDPGDCLFSCTDGITEAADSSGELFGDARLMEALAVVDSPTELIRRVREQLRLFVGGAEQSDDITMLALCYRGEGREDVSRIRLANALPELSRLETFIRGFCRELRLPQELCGRLNLVLEEIFTNIISYAYPDGKEHDIFFSLSVRGGDVLIEVEDDGIYFDPTAAPEPDLARPLAEKPVGGLGIHLVRNLVGSLAYARRGGHNVLSMTMSLSSEQGQVDAC